VDDEYLSARVDECTSGRETATAMSGVGFVPLTEYFDETAARPIGKAYLLSTTPDDHEALTVDPEDLRVLLV